MHDRVWALITSSISAQEPADSSPGVVLYPFMVDFSSNERARQHDAQVVVHVL